MPRALIALFTAAACAGPSSSAVRIYGAGTQVFPAGWLSTGDLLVTELRDGEPRIAVVDRDGKVLTSVAGPSPNTWAGDPHPDSTRFLAESYVDGISDLYVIDLRGQVVERLTQTPWNEWHPAWSPDGRSVVYDSDSAGASPRLVRHDVSSGVRTHPTSAPAAEQGGSWSPDGSRLAFHRLMRGGTTDYDVVILDIASGRERVVTSGGDDSSSPSWSPDGTRIAFSSNRSGRYRIYVTCAAGEGSPVLIEGPTVDSKYPKWSRDGSRIVYQVLNDGLWTAAPPAGQVCPSP